jgi:hypothetical protein
MFQRNAFFLGGLLLLLVSAKFRSSPILVHLMMKEALSSTETLVLTRVTVRHIPEDGILHTHYDENLKSCILPYSPDQVSDPPSPLPIG